MESPSPQRATEKEPEWPWATQGDSFPSVGSTIPVDSRNLVGEFEGSTILAEWTVPEPKSVSAIDYCDLILSQKRSSNSSSSFQSTTIHITISSALHSNPPGYTGQALVLFSFYIRPLRLHEVIGLAQSHHQWQRRDLKTNPLTLALRFFPLSQRLTKGLLTQYILKTKKKGGGGKWLLSFHSIPRGFVVTNKMTAHSSVDFCLILRIENTKQDIRAS